MPPHPSPQSLDPEAVRASPDRRLGSGGPAGHVIQGRLGEGRMRSKPPATSRGNARVSVRMAFRTQPAIPLRRPCFNPESSFCPWSLLLAQDAGKGAFFVFFQSEDQAGCLRALCLEARAHLVPQSAPAHLPLHAGDTPGFSPPGPELVPSWPPALVQIGELSGKQESVGRW